MKPSQPSDSSSPFDRRSLLLGVAGAATLAALTPNAAAAARKPRFEISLAEWSLHRALQGGRMTNLDFPRVAKVEYGIGAIEYVNSFFKDRATDFRYLRELESRCKEHGVESRLIMIDGEGALGDADAAARAKAIENHLRWIAAASFLGCMAIRVNAYGEGPREEVAKRVADSLQHLGAYADPYGIDVIVENHGGDSSDGGWLAGVMQAADHPRVGTLPDFGNFSLGGGREYDRYQGVADMMPWARAVSAKSHDFDAAGNEVHTDYRRMLKIVLDAGYASFVGIEYEGEQLSEHDGIVATKKLLERVREELA
ncbi:MAG: sugar phosphate isomerase/epimerase [Planctomycetes bacterium]|nr:sugar phosphate isomerase/epimerase [Planctomycetota bacterium]